ncbi:flavodoxin family protein [Leifsonia sp. P73]|uniref:flavodoxin family protein n=1 Tax=Leifsonia sp. P73 TaxID=3423959 RepID=UPI003DA48470
MASLEGSPVVVAVIGSERTDGDTAAVVRSCRGHLEERGIRFETVVLAEQSMIPCGPCGGCNFRDSHCEIDDDVPAIVDRLISADGIIYAVPVHGFGTASLLQTFIERAGVGYLRFERPLANKVGGVIVVGRRYSHLDVVSQLYHNMMLNRMLLVGSGFPAIFSTETGRPPLDDAEGVVALEAMLDRMAEAIWLLREHEQAFGRTMRVPGSKERAS